MSRPKRQPVHRRDIALLKRQVVLLERQVKSLMRRPPSTSAPQTACPSSKCASSPKTEVASRRLGRRGKFREGAGRQRSPFITGKTERRVRARPGRKTLAARKVGSANHGFLGAASKHTGQDCYAVTRAWPRTGNRTEMMRRNAQDMNRRSVSVCEVVAVLPIATGHSQAGFEVSPAKTKGPAISR